MDCFKVDKNRNLVRMFNALPDEVAVDVYSNGKLVFSNLKYKEFTPYTYGIMDKQKIDVYKTGTKTNPLIRASITVPDEQIFTISLIGNTGEESLFVDEDDKMQKPSTKDAVVRIINLSPELGVIDVKFNGVAYADDIEYRDETEYTYLPIGKYVVAVEDGNNVNQFAQGNYEFKANRIYTIYIVGNKPNIEIIQSVDGNTYACM